MGSQQEDMYLKIAGMLAAGVAETQVAEAVGLSPGRISQLKEEPDFIPFLSAAQSKRAAEAMEVNDGWDSIERLALKTLQRNLTHNTNPDFALRAAMIANRAIRKGGVGNNQLTAPPAGGAVIINLNAAFVSALSGTSSREANEAIAITKANISAPATPDTTQGQTAIASQLEQAMQGALLRPQPVKVVDVLGPKSVRDLLVPRIPGSDGEIL